MAQLEALEERRTIALRHDRFNAAMISSAIINVNRPADSDPVSPLDFLPGFDRTPGDIEKEKLRRSVKHAVAIAFTNMSGKTAEEVQEVKRRMIARMTDNGIEDPEELIREVYPNL